jgi:hypothetical protein
LGLTVFAGVRKTCASQDEHRMAQKKKSSVALSENERSERIKRQVVIAIFSDGQP